MSDFLTMGGYGFYVWTAYGITVLLLAIPLIKISYLIRKHKKKSHASAI